jgi:hypothetical protein
LSVEGHSGSPVTTNDGGTLLGMHIAGGKVHAFMIPAWHLFQSARYENIAPTEQLSLFLL